MKITLAIEVELDFSLWSKPNDPPLSSPWWYYRVAILNHSKIPGMEEELGQYTAGPFPTEEEALLAGKRYVEKLKDKNHEWK